MVWDVVGAWYVENDRERRKEGTISLSGMLRVG